ncbi:MAG: ATP-binding protein [Solirubrobacteraceae bacterium]
MSRGPGGTPRTCALRAAGRADRRRRRSRAARPGRAQPARQRRDVPGSGLGLAIVRQAIEAQGGEVVVDGAVPGGGARFEIRLAGATWRPR